MSPNGSKFDGEGLGMESMLIAPHPPACFPANLFDIDRPGETDVEAARCWRVVHVKPRQEKSLARDLEARQVPFFLPTYRKQTRIGGRKMIASLPLFPGYLFGHFNADERLTAFSTQRTVGILEVPDQDRLIEDMLSLHRAIRAGVVISGDADFQPGTPITIKTGPLAGMRGKVVRKASRARLVIEVAMLHRDVPIEVDEADLERLL